MGFVPPEFGPAMAEIILATGEGDRTKKGTSYVLMVEKADSD